MTSTRAKSIFLEVWTPPQPKTGSEPAKQEIAETSWLSSLLKSLKPVRARSMGHVRMLCEKDNRIGERGSDVDERLGFANGIWIEAESLRGREGTPTDDSVSEYLDLYLCSGYFLDFDASELSGMTEEQRKDVMGLRACVSMGVALSLTTLIAKKGATLAEADVIMGSVLDVCLKGLLEVSRDKDAFSEFREEVGGKRHLFLLFERAAYSAEHVENYALALSLAREARKYKVPGFATEDCFEVDERIENCERRVREAQNNRSDIENGQAGQSASEKEWTEWIAIPVKQLIGKGPARHNCKGPVVQDRILKPWSAKK